MEPHRQSLTIKIIGMQFEVYFKVYVRSSFVKNKILKKNSAVTENCEA